MLHIIANCGPCEEYIEQAVIASIRDQSFTDWQAHCTVDPSRRRHLRRAQTCSRDGDRRIRIHRNPERRYAADERNSRHREERRTRRRT